MITKSPALMALATVFLLSWSRADEQEPLDSPFLTKPPMLSLPQLMAQSQALVGKELRVCGFVWLHLGEGSLYLSKDDWSNGMNGNSLRLRELAPSSPSLILGYRYLHGKVISDPEGPGGIRLQVLRLSEPSLTPAAWRKEVKDRLAAIIARLSKEDKSLTLSETERFELTAELLEVQTILQQLEKEVPASSSPKGD